MHDNEQRSAAVTATPMNREFHIRDKDAYRRDFIAGK
jgi:hypothetical protein